EDIAAWRVANAASEPFNLACKISMSTAALVSVLCSSANDQPPLGFSYRLTDGSRIAPEDLFAANKNGLRAATKQCLAEHVHRPANDYEATLEQLPTWPASHFTGFELDDYGVTFVVGYDAKTRNREVRPSVAYCHLSYNELKTRLEQLGTPKRGPS